MMDLLHTLAASTQAAAADGHGAHDIAQTTSAAWPLLYYTVRFGFLIVMIGIALCVWRILRGPHLADRVLASDSLAVHVAALVILLVILMRSTAFFDAVMAVAIMGFASTVAFGQYIGARADEARRSASAAKRDAALDAEEAL